MTPAGEPFRWHVRVYYEDTDAVGVVYYANYLKYLERARTEWLAALGFVLPELESAHGIAFIVHRLEIDYRQPARLGDALDVTVAMTELGRSRLVVRQRVLREGAMRSRAPTRASAHAAADARVVLACVDRGTLRPTRIPALLVTRLRGEPLESAP